MTMRAYPLRIPDGVLRLAELRSQEERTDKTTALRQWLYAAAEEHALHQVAAGRLTLSHAAELLDLSVYDLQRQAQARGIALGATAEQYRQARDTARHLRPTHRVGVQSQAPPRLARQAGHTQEVLKLSLAGTSRRLLP